MDQRKGAYGSLKVTSALVWVDGAWKNYLTRLEILSVGDTSNYERSMIYENLLLKETTVEQAELVKILSQILDNGTFSLPSLGIDPTEGNLQRYPASPSYYQPSKSQGFELEWASNIYLSTSPKTQNLQLPNGPLAAIGQPLFDTAQMALTKFFGFQTANVPWQGAVMFILPNYTARIKQIKLGSTRMTVNFVLGAGARYSDLLAKVYLEAPESIEQKDFDPMEGDNVIPLGIVPHLYVLYLFSKTTGEVIDYRRFGAGWANLKDVVIETSPDNIEQIISRGENNRVEFKLAMPKNWNDFAETAVAMTNKGGGTIILGVDDNGIILGVEDPKIVDSITDALRNSCEPSIEPEFSSQQIQGKTVVVIQFADGTDKPYILKGKGIYVRVGATDRMANRDEIVSLATNQGGPFG